MSTPHVVPVESKSTKKHKAKVEAAGTPAVVDRPPSANGSVINGHGGNDTGNGAAAQSPYLKELHKNIRSLSKKIAGSAKADSVLEQNPGLSIDELVTQKKLNADQKAQLVKKPQLEAQLAQLEDQVKQFQNFAQELEDKHSKEKAALLESHEAEIEDAKKQATEVANNSISDKLGQHLKVVAAFLHTAAAKRGQSDQESDEAKAFEGILLLLYQGTSISLSTLHSLAMGESKPCPDVEGNPLGYTFAEVQQVALKESIGLGEEEITAVEDLPPPSTAPETSTDPTIANAGLTELEDTNSIPAHTNGDAPAEATKVPEQASTGDDAANAVAEAKWDPEASATISQAGTGEDWVQVPRDPAETETGSIQPSAQQSTTNWAEEVGDAATEVKSTPENDGFEQVSRNRGRGGRGEFRGRGGQARGGRGEFRGRGGQSRGGRGEYRGRGGQGRSGRPGPRGDRPAVS